MSRLCWCLLCLFILLPFAAHAEDPKAKELNNKVDLYCYSDDGSTDKAECANAQREYDEYVIPRYGTPPDWKQGEPIVVNGCKGFNQAYSYNVGGCIDVPGSSSSLYSPEPLVLLGGDAPLVTIRPEDIQNAIQNMPQYDFEHCTDNADGTVSCPQRTDASSDGRTQEGHGTCNENETWDENALSCVANQPATQEPQTNTAQNQNQPQDLSTEVADARSKLDACLAAQKKANQCCTAPESCLGEAMGMGGSDSGMALQMIQTVMGGMAMSAQAAGSIGAMCGKMKTISYGAALMNAALGAACQKNVSQCQSTCSGAQSRVAALEQQLQAQQQQMSQAVGTATANLQAQSNANQAQLNSVKEIARSSERAITACATYDNQVQRSAQAAMASMMAAQMASDCKKQATASTSTQTESITANDFAVNCSTAGAASNPVCQQQCSRPGAENDPVCKAILAQLNGQQNTGGLAVTDPAAAGTGTPSGFDIGDPDEDAQLVDPKTSPTDGTSVASVQGGTGGLSGGLGASPGGDDGAGMGGTVGAASLDNKLIRGFSSGTGYSTGGLRSGGGGFGGYGGYGRQPASTGKKFKLTDFLPGGKHAPKRHPTGFGATGSAHPEIGPASANIFQMISNRYYLLCKQDYIADCESLKKRGCPINVLGDEACPRP